MKKLKCNQFFGAATLMVSLLQGNISYGAGGVKYQTEHGTLVCDPTGTICNMVLPSGRISFHQETCMSDIPGEGYFINDEEFSTLNNKRIDPIGEYNVYMANNHYEEISFYDEEDENYKTRYPHVFQLYDGLVDSKIIFQDDSLLINGNQIQVSKYDRNIINNYLNNIAPQVIHRREILCKYTEYLNYRDWGYNSIFVNYVEKKDGLKFEVVHRDSHYVLKNVRIEPLHKNNIDQQNRRDFNFKKQQIIEKYNTLKAKD